MQTSCWYGGPTQNTWSPQKWSFRGNDMTAISMAYYVNYGFLIVADGRCRADDESVANKTKETDMAQKIFPVETTNITMAYALTGFAGDEQFDLISETKKQMALLSMSHFASGNQYINRFCRNIKGIVQRAKKNGLIGEFSKHEPPEPEEKGRKFKFYFMGYFNALPFWVEAKFYYHPEQTGEVQFELRKNDFEISQCVRSVGSQKIANMIYGQEPVDPRLAKYKTNSNQLDHLAGYIKACSDPVALEIDPACKAIGGHIHAAEITQIGFRWLIEPCPG